MTTETPADTVIERAAEIIARMSWEGPGQEWPLWEDATEEDRQKIRKLTVPIARALADEVPDLCAALHASILRPRMERAEAERDELRATVARVRALADEPYDVLDDGMTAFPVEVVAVGHLRTALNGGAGGQQHGE